MSRRAKYYQFYDRIRDSIYARYERLFPSPIEVRLIEILGGSTFTIGTIRRGDRQLTITLSRGKLLRSERFRRAVLDGKGVLANDVKWAIAIQGPEYERDVVAAYEHDELLKEQGWRVRYIPARDLWQSPTRVRSSVQQFLA